MTLTPERIAAGWLPHDGGDCPVPADSRPRVMFRSGMVMRGPQLTARGWNWRHSPKRDSFDDIIAYLPEKTDD